MSIGEKEPGGLQSKQHARFLSRGYFLPTLMCQGTGPVHEALPPFWVRVARLVCIFFPGGKKIEVLPPSSRRQATVHRTSAFRRVRSSCTLPERAPPNGGALSGAGDRDRTGTLFTARDFKSLVSACSTTPAYCKGYGITFFPLRQVTTDPDSKQRQAGSDPGTSSVPAYPAPSSRPRSAWRQNRTPYCRPSALPGI